MRHSKCDKQRRRLGKHPAGHCFPLTLALFLLTSNVRAQNPTDIVHVGEGASSVDNVRQGSTFQAAVILDIKYEVGISVQVATELPAGRYDLRGKLTYEPCSDKGCEIMKTNEVKIPVYVVDQNKGAPHQ